MEAPDNTSFPLKVRAIYTWGAAGLVSERLESGSRWYHFGPQGETRQLTNNAGQVVDTYLYTAYGQPVTSTGTDRNPFRYGGQFGYYTDTDLGNGGLILCGARWYSPAVGRWLSRDPIGYEGGPNLYEYWGGDPVNGVDADGLSAADIFSNFLAGFGDSLTLGLTAYVRRGIHYWQDGDNRDVVDDASTAYKVGEWTETIGEVVVTCGSSTLKKAAAKKLNKVARKEFEDQMDKQLGNAAEDYIKHHKGPLSGHPVNITGGRKVSAMFPTRGLPGHIHSSRLNIKLFPNNAAGRAAHMAAHRRLLKTERALQPALHPGLTGARAARNAAHDMLNQ